MNQIEEASSLKVKEARAFLGLSQTKLGESLGVSLRTVQNWESDVNPIPLGQLKLLNNLIKEKAKSYTNKNGNSFTQTTDGQLIIEVPIFPMEAYAKYLEEWTSDAQFFEEYEKITFAVDKIGKGNYLGFKILGDSMNGGKIDDTPAKAIVLGRELQKHHWLDGFSDSKHGWIILTTKNILFKDITAFDKEKATILCHSRNESPEYCDFPLVLNDVYRIFKVIKRTF